MGGWVDKVKLARVSVVPQSALRVEGSAHGETLRVTFDTATNPSAEGDRCPVLHAAATLNAGVGTTTASFTASLTRNVDVGDVMISDELGYGNGLPGSEGYAAGLPATIVD